VSDKEREVFALQKLADRVSALIDKQVYVLIYILSDNKKSFPHLFPHLRKVTPKEAGLNGGDISLKSETLC
jgi:hypothetical protein